MKPERGNILFLILLAVILFAALSYAVTSSLRGGGKDGGDEKTETIAATIVQQLIATETALQRMMLVRGVSVQNIDMHQTGRTMNGNIAGCATDACNLYHPSGGGAYVPVISPAAIKPGTQCSHATEQGILPYYLIINATGIGSEKNDIMLYYCGISPSVCRAINEKLGVRLSGDTNPINVATGASGTDYAAWNGAINIDAAVTTNQTTAADARVAGHRTYCSEYHADTHIRSGGLYHIIHAR